MNLYRMHLKTDVKDLGLRKELIGTCLNNGFLAIGWSFLHQDREIKTPEDLINTAKEHYGKVPPSLSTFLKVQPNDLIWTRDLDGCGFLCRVVSKAKPEVNHRLDIGCILEVENFKIGTSMPGRVVSSFIPSKAIQQICDNKIMAFSQVLYNDKSKSDHYEIKCKGLDLFGLLHPLDVEELVCCYVQIKFDAFLSKNSIAKKDTTIKIEGEFYPRSSNSDYESIVLQVKTGASWVPVKEYSSYADNNKLVVLFFECEHYDSEYNNILCLSKQEILDFAYEYQDQLPPILQTSIQLCKTGL